MTQAQAREMAALGWIAPNRKPGQSGKHLTGSPNCSLEARPPVSFGRVAELATRTLASIHKAARPEDLEVRFGNASDGMDWMNAPRRPRPARRGLVGRVRAQAFGRPGPARSAQVFRAAREGHRAERGVHVRREGRDARGVGLQRVASRGERLTHAERREMAALGWIAPNLLPGRSSKHLTGSPNHCVDAPPPAAFERIAALATKTLASIHKAARPADLECASAMRPT